ENRHRPAVCADEVFLINLRQKACHDLAEQPMTSGRRQAIGIASVCTRRIGVGMETDRDLRVEMFARIKMSGFERGPHAVDESGAQGDLLLKRSEERRVGK